MSNSLVGQLWVEGKSQIGYGLIGRLIGHVIGRLIGRLNEVNLANTHP